MGKKHQTAKHRKRQKKEIANRKARQLATKKATIIIDEREPKEIIEKLKELPDTEVKVVSPARRAFQDV